MADPFANSDVSKLNSDQESDMSNLNVLVTQMNCDITAEQYIDVEANLSTCLALMVLMILTDGRK